MKLDFNSTSFSHPKSGDLTLANPDDAIRNFWIEHTKRCRWISEEMGKYQDDPCIMNCGFTTAVKKFPPAVSNIVRYWNSRSTRFLQLNIRT